jgi:hypothetical protein
VPPPTVGATRTRSPSGFEEVINPKSITDRVDRRFHFREQLRLGIDDHFRLKGGDRCKDPS